MPRLKNPKIELGLLFVVLALLFLPNQAVLADIAPPAEPPGGNISPASSTQVQMLAETVQIQVQPVAYQSQPRLAAEFASANVKASFTMRNQGESAEQMQVRFPLMDPSGMGDGFGRYPEIQDIQVRVNEKVVTTNRLTTPTPNTWDKNAPPIAWASFEVSFPPGRKVNINVRYTLQPTGYFPVAQFVYILETGAGWYGPIGSADLTLEMPYEVNSQNLVYGDYETIPGGQTSDRQITWHYDNLEPTQNDNLRVDIVAPKVWMDVLQARQAVQNNPDDASAWQSLAQVSETAARDESGKGWLRTDPGGQALALESKRAYEQVLAMRPKDPSLWAGYENLMVRILMQIDYPSVDKQPTTSDPDLQKLVQAINQVLTLDPQNEEVKSEAQWVADTYNDVLQQNPDGSLSLVGAAPAATGKPTSRPTSTLSPTPPPTVVRTATASAPAATPAPATSTSAAAQVSTPAPTVSGATTEVDTTSAVPASAVPSTSTSTSPIGFFASVFLVGLCIIVLVALGGLGLAVWYLRRDVRRSQNGNDIHKDDGSP